MRRLERLQVNLFTNTFIGTYPVLQMLLSAILEVLYLSRKKLKLRCTFFLFLRFDGAVFEMFSIICIVTNSKLLHSKIFL